LKTRYDEAIQYISEYLKQPLSNLLQSLKEQVQEIRLRGDKPVVLVLSHGCYFIDQNGNLMEKGTDNNRLMCSYLCLEQTVRAICGYSLHTHQWEMTRGYITLRGGHRVGLASTAVEKDGRVTSVKEISSINIRIARQIIGLADPLVSLGKQGGLLIIGRPGSGKTTLLRDLARQLSGTRSPLYKVTLLDERGELAAVWDGIPQNDIGVNTDVLNGFPKSIAMEIAIRSLSPDIVICDEIGSEQEAIGLLGCVNTGAKVVATIHADSMEELRFKPWAMQLIQGRVFSNLVLLDRNQGKGQIERIVKTDDWLAEIGRNTIHRDCNQLGRDKDPITI